MNNRPANREHRASANALVRQFFAKFSALLPDCSTVS
jgi:hypothetical protein